MVALSGSWSAIQSQVVTFNGSPSDEAPLFSHNIRSPQVHVSALFHTHISSRVALNANIGPGKYPLSHGVYLIYPNFRLGPTS